MTIDTHEGYKQLIEAGVPEPQAEATVRLFSDWVERQLVTREYLDLRLSELRSELRQEMGEVRQEMAEMEKRLMSRLITVVGLAVAFLSVVIAAFSFIN